MALTETLAADQRRAVGGGESDGSQAQATHPHLGVVTGKPLSGGQGTPDSPCKYCGMVDGHTADCPVIS